jgi:hypothetical protein
MRMFNVMLILRDYYHNAPDRYLRGMECLYHALPLWRAFCAGNKLCVENAEAPAVYIIYIGMSVKDMDVNAINVRIPLCISK